VTKASCVITARDLKAEGDEPDAGTQSYARSLGGHDGCHNDDAGHILANRLGGYGTDPINIMPQAPHLNRGLWEAFESSIHDCFTVSGAKKATLKVRIAVVCE
jgi:hypothetical protein